MGINLLLELLILDGACLRQSMEAFGGLGGQEEGWMGGGMRMAGEWIGEEWVGLC